jgi:hypothetical protein
VSELDAVVADYVDQTLVCSFWHMMQRAPACATLRAVGAEAIPALLRNLASPNSGGMCVMHLLAELTGEWPEAEKVADAVAPGWVGIRVDDAAAAWLRWGREKGLIPSETRERT